MLYFYRIDKKKMISLLNKAKKLLYLFDTDFPPRVASVFIGGKKISKEEFLKLKKEYLKKKKTSR